jgi:hypothetical protein
MRGTPSWAGLGLLIIPIIIIVLVLVLLKIICFWKIVSKAGYPGVLSLLTLLPLVNLIMFLVFAFAEWPVEKEVKQLKTLVGRFPSQ